MRLSSDPAARRRLAALLSAGLVAFGAGAVVGAGRDAEEPAAPAPARAERAERALAAVDRLSLREQVGQVTVSSFPDRAPPGYVVRRLQARETAGVILFGPNAGSPSEWRRLTRAIQRRAGGEALVMVDQEGGDIRTVSFAGPPAAQPAQGSPAGVRRAARQAARQLAGVGVNVNLAPVADVSGGGPFSVMGSRAFAGDARAVARSTVAAIEGMRSAGVAATAKHFPGLGRATANTDDASVVVPGAIGGDLAPFRAAVDADAPLVMLSHALYPALDSERIASQSSAIVTGLLRRDLRYRGVIVTDSLEAQAVLDRSGVGEAAERSIAAGADLVLMTGSASWNIVHPWLLRRARASERLRERIRRSAARVLALKERLGLKARSRSPAP